MRSLEFVPEDEGDVKVFDVESWHFLFLRDGFGHCNNSERDESSLNQDDTEWMGDVNN